MTRALVLALALLACACHKPRAQSVGVASSPALLVPGWFVDPANTTTCASDGNTCQSATCTSTGVGPCSTYAEIVSRWGTVAPQLGQATSITFLSDQAAGADLVDVRPRMSNAAQWLTVQGTLLQQTTATIGTFTARNRVTPQTNTITASGQSGAYWATFVGMLVNDTTAGAWFWIEKDLGTATAQITEPVPSTINRQFPVLSSYVTIANGDALTIYRPTKLNCSHIGGSELLSVTLLQHVVCTGLGASTSTAVLGLASLSEDRFDPNINLDGCSGQPIAIRSYAANIFVDSNSAALGGNWQAGAIKSPTSVSFGCAAWTDQRTGLDADILIDTGTSFHAASTTVFGRVYFGTNVLLDTDGGGLYNGGTYDGQGLFFSDVFIWGPGRLDMHDHAEWVCDTTCTASLLVTGGITMHNGGQTTAFPWSAASHAWGAAQTITGANIDAAGAMCDPATGDCYRKRQ